MHCRMTIHLRNGEHLRIEKLDYEGFRTRPMTWDTIVGKFEALTSNSADAQLRRDIVQAVADLATINVSELMALLQRVGNGRKDNS
jgi:2-methylcitrate dehydratase